MLVIKYYLIAFIVFLVLDMLWLGVIAKDLYARQIGFLMTADIRWGAALVFYLIYIAGLVAFVILPANQHASWQHALLYGAGFGLVCYAAYDLTNLATLKNWPLALTMIDMAWGTVISALTAAVTYWLGIKLSALTQ